MTSWGVVALSGIFLMFQTPPGQIPDRVILNATFEGKEIGFDFVRLECMRLPKAPEASGCWLDEILLMGCDSGTAELFPRHYDIRDLAVRCRGRILRARLDSQSKPVFPA